MRISLIAAASENNVIGHKNSLPWHLPDDFKFFKEKTDGHPVITGRKNFESMGRPLPSRRNIVITRQPNYTAEGCDVVSSLEEALELAKENEDEEIFIIGGGQIYNISMEVANRIYLTRIHAEIEGDVFFPEIDEDVWGVTDQVEHPKDEKHEHSFTILTYDKKEV